MVLPPLISTQRHPPVKRHTHSLTAPTTHLLPHPTTPPHQALLLSATFDPTNAGALKRSSTPWSKIPRGSTLMFDSRGKGEVSVAASLNFVPAEILTFPTYRGLWVQRIVQLREGGGPVVAAPLAATVTIVVQVRGQLVGVGWE